MMLTSVPNGKKLEIKKTSVKKLSPYLNQKMAEGVLKIEKAAKGVEKIASVEFKVIDSIPGLNGPISVRIIQNLA